MKFKNRVTILKKSDTISCIIMLNKGLENTLFLIKIFGIELVTGKEQK